MLHNGICGTHGELFELTKVTHYVLKINHLDMINYGNNSSFDDMTILK